MKHYELREMAIKLPDQSVVKNIMAYFVGKSEKDIVDLSTPLIHEFEGRRRIALLKLICKKINKHSNLLSILEIGLAKCLASEIGYWIELVEPKVGLEKLILLLASNNNKEAVDMAIYHLAFLGNEETQLKIKRLLIDAGLKPYEDPISNSV
jgi:hypothetical protein